MPRHAAIDLSCLDDPNYESKPAGPTRYQCRHVFTGGQRCGSPSLRGEDFCYFHHSTRKPVEDAPRRRRRQCRFTVRQPEDRTAIQLTLGEVLQKLANNDLDPRRAGLLLYGLQIASLNLPKVDPRAERSEPVAEITMDPTHGPIAPVEEYFGPDGQKKSSTQLLLERLGLLDEDDAASDHNPEPENQPPSANHPGDCQGQEQVHPDPLPYLLLPNP